MSLDLNTVTKVISVIAVIIPMMYAVIYYMVDFGLKAMDLRVAAIEEQINKGARFTADDGARLSVYIDRHGEEIAEVRAIIAALQSRDAECKVNVGNNTYRLNRLEDRYYSDNNGKSDQKDQNDFRDAPFMPDPGLIDQLWYANQWMQ